MSFGAAFDGDSCRIDTECRERPKYSKAEVVRMRQETREKSKANQKIWRPFDDESPSYTPSISPSISVFPSAAPQHFGRCEEETNTCQAEVRIYLLEIEE